jgi:tartrate dehydrogenase/decarboxylase/D-malate dehydrogenase
MFEPVHGFAPDIAGKGLANPIAMVWTVQMMLEFLEETELSSKVMDSINEILKDKERLTGDLGGKASTSQVGDFISEVLEKLK